MSKSLNIYKEIFSIYNPSYTNKTLYNNYTKITDKHIDESEVRQIINDEVFDNYLNESVIKSSFIKNVLSKKSPKINTGLFELNVGSSRADLCMINGKSYVYEIKTEYDSFYRLDKQLTDYNNFFDYIFVIVPKEDVKKVKEHISKDIGIIYYYKNRLNNISFVEKRKALLNNNHSKIEQLTSLTKKDLLLLNNKPIDYSIDKTYLISKLANSYTTEEINNVYKELIKTKYYDKWMFLHENIENIYILDYQWFFKNNINYKKVYR